MTVVPRTVADKIGFYQSRLAKWAASAADIGTTPAEVAGLEAAVREAAEARAAQRAAQSAARAATLRLAIALEAMGRAGAAIMKQIRARAGTTGDGIYSLASIPPPASRSPLGAPGKPEGFWFALDQAGALELRWKCDNPAGSVGTIYQVWRGVCGGGGNEGGGRGEFTYLGASGSKRFVDKTIPAGCQSITYQVQAMRSTTAGPSAQFIVNLGVASADGPGGATPAAIQVKAGTRAA